MKNVFIVLAVLGLLGILSWPYVGLYQLDRALQSGQDAQLAKYVDLAAIRAGRAQALRKDADRLIGAGNDDVSAFFRESARALTSTAIDHIVDLEWVRTSLRRDGKPGDARPFPPLLGEVSYAFFDGPDRFLVRLGDLDDEPTHLLLALKDWRWTLVAIYD